MIFLDVFDSSSPEDFKIGIDDKEVLAVEFVVVVVSFLEAASFISKQTKTKKEKS